MIQWLKTKNKKIGKSKLVGGFSTSFSVTEQYKNDKDIENLKIEIRKFVLVEIFRILPPILVFFSNTYDILTTKLTVNLNHRRSFIKCQRIVCSFHFVSNINNWGTGQCHNGHEKNFKT